MLLWPWVIRAVAVCAGFWIAMQWLALGVPWAALFNWLMCVGGAEAIIYTSRRARERRRIANRPLRGGRRRTDLPAG